VTGLDYAINRHYDPQLARFLEPDPRGASAMGRGQPQTNNPYTYARDDPINLLDPRGLRFNLIYRGGGCTAVGSGPFTCTYYFDSFWTPDPDEYAGEDRRTERERAGRDSRRGAGRERPGRRPRGQQAATARPLSTQRAAECSAVYNKWQESNERQVRAAQALAANEKAWTSIYESGEAEFKKILMEAGGEAALYWGVGHEPRLGLALAAFRLVIFDLEASHHLEELDRLTEEWATLAAAKQDARWEANARAADLDACLFTPATSFPASDG
jgi:RHS repeat-associated protein